MEKKQVGKNDIRGNIVIGMVFFVSGILFCGSVIYPMAMFTHSVESASDKLTDHVEVLREGGRSEEYIDGWLTAIYYFEHELMGATNITATGD